MNSESGATSSSDHYTDQYALEASGNWVGVSGTGASSAGGSTHSACAEAGVYGSSSGDGNSGTWKESGNSDSNYLTQTASTLDASGWTTSGTQIGGGDDASDDSYQGAGAFTVSGGSAGAVSGDLAPTGSGTTAESGADHSADSYTSTYVSGADGNWYAAGGSGTSTASGNTHASNASNGAYGYTFTGGGVGGTWNQAGSSDTNQYYSATSLSHACATAKPVTVCSLPSCGGGNQNRNSASLK